MILSILTKMSDFGDAIISKAVHHIGLSVTFIGGAAYTVGSDMVERSSAKAVAESAQPALPDFVVAVLPYAGLITMLTGCMLIIKYLVDSVVAALRLYYERKDKATESGNNNP